MMLTTWHVRKQALLIWAGRSHHKVPSGFNVNVGYCGTACEELLKMFQHAQGIAADGQWGPVTEAHMEAFLHPPEPTPAKDARQRFLAEWWWALAADLNYKSVHRVTAFPYLEQRPYSSLSYWQEHRVPMAGYDCSSSTVAAAHRAGRKDPTGMGYGGFGNTQSMIDHLPRRPSVAACVPGDLIVFGGEMALQHVVTVAQQGDNPMVFSHGGPGIGHWPLSWETAAHLFQPIIPLAFD